jgi:hypothetical protein
MEVRISGFLRLDALLNVRVGRHQPKHFAVAKERFRRDRLRQNAIAVEMEHVIGIGVFVRVGLYVC